MTFIIILPGLGELPIGKLLRSLVGIIVLFMLVSACSRKTEVERENKKREKILVEKINKNIKLSSAEINNLSGILLWERKYDDGIKLFDKFKDSEEYRDELYLILFNLSILCIEKAKGITEKLERRELIKKGERSLTLGFDNAPDKAMAYYLRAKGYAVMECIQKAQNDLEEAINIAKSKDIVFFEDGIYLAKDQFIQIATDDFNRLRVMHDNCILGSANP